MKTKKSGFTLIELLVVIAIIALLLGILIPALARVKMAAQTLICSTNLKSYGVGLQAYAQDNSGKAPFAFYWLYARNTLDFGGGTASLPSHQNVAAKGDPADPGSGGFICPPECRWHYDKDEPDGSFWPYVEDKNVHMCPTFKSIANRQGCQHCGAPGINTIPFNPMYSYAMNFFVGWDWETFLSLPSGADEAMRSKEISLKLLRVTRPAQCFAFSEENLWSINMESGYRENYSASTLNDNALWTAARPGFYTDNIATYHNVNTAQENEGKANLVFVDGHVETMRGLPEQQAYLQYGKPYVGHEKLSPIW